MAGSINRRNWLKSISLASASLAVAPTLSAFSAPRKIYKQPQVKTYFPPNRFDLSKLKVRLLANENPYGPSDKVRLAIMESVSMGNRYGHQQAQKLIEMIAEKEGVSTDHILIGPGSTDLLEKIAITHFIDGGNIVSADPAYMSLIKTATAFSADWKSIPLLKDWSHDLDGMEQAIDEDTKLVYVCNPNNPTGSLTATDKLKAFCEKISSKVPIFVDEAYLEFLEDPAKHTMVNLINEGKNIIVARTFSKIHAMAGLRVGYIVALPETIEKVKSLVRSNMGMNITALKGAMASLEDLKFQENSKKWTNATRAYVSEELASMGYEYIPSHTSFILFPIEMEGPMFLEQMYSAGVGVRFFEIFGKPHCRVSLGTMDEMTTFVDTIKKVLN